MANIKQMIFRSFYGIITISLFISCAATEDDKIKINEDNLTGIWKCSEIELDAEKLEVDNEVIQYRNNQIIYEGYFLSFFPDNSGTLTIGTACEQFNWKLDTLKETIYFGQIDQLDGNQAISLTKSESSMELKISNDYGYSIFVKVNEIVSPNYEIDPFFPENNLWRFKPTIPESTTQLKHRIKNYLQHYKYLFEVSLNDSARKFTNKNAKGILKIYRGGIGLVKKDEISEDWIDCFYNEDQAIAAYDILNEYLGSKVIRKSSNEDWIHSNHKILEELLTKIENDIAEQ